MKHINSTCRFFQDGKCACMTDTHNKPINCQDVCTMKQTESEYKASLEKAHNRLRKLTPDKQAAYALKYYRKIMPWARKYQKRGVDNATTE